MYKGKKVSLVFPVYNEEDNLGNAIDDFRSLKIIDEIIVVDNNSSDDSAEIAKTKKVKLIDEDKQGYGYALRMGMKEAKGDYIVLCEPDGTFNAKDLLKLLREIGNYDLVLGTRTDSGHIAKDANMKGLLRWGNIVLAKLLQVLYGTNTLTDCGCTFRVFRKKVVKEILPKVTVGGSHFLPDSVTCAAKSGFDLIEIPVRYNQRVGNSKITGSFKGSVEVGWNMFILVLKNRFN